MKQNNLTLSDLTREIHEWQERYPRLKDDELFVAWFLRAYVVDDESQSVAALSGGSGDKDADAVYLDEQNKIVFIVQSKYRKELWGKAESRSDVKSFAELAQDLCGDESLFKIRLKATSPKVRQLLHESRKRIQHGYRLQLYYVTIGRVSKNVFDEARAVVRRYADKASIDLFDGGQVLVKLADYLDGVAPPIPSLDLPMEAGNGIISTGALNRKDNNTGIESWIFSMTANSVAECFEKTGVRLFARNVRGFLGSTEINSSMEATLEREPWNFWYYNNGITIVCDKAGIVPISGQNVLRVANPQVINGQQTTRMLHAKGRDGKKASVVVRVFQVPREVGEEANTFDTLVSNIVQATNWQNAIRPSDLMSNDRRQIELERRLRKLNYQYIRKRQSKGEARRASGSTHVFIIKKDEIAQAVAACELDPAIVRMGKERLFEERWYSLVFPTGDPNYYLTRYWLTRATGNAARGYPERAYAKWVVTNFMWKQLRPYMASKVRAEIFRKENEKYVEPFTGLVRAVDRVYRAALQYYRSKRGKGDKAIDVSTFFQRRKLNLEFDKFWNSAANSHRGPFRKAWKKFEKEFTAALEE